MGAWPGSHRKGPLGWCGRVTEQWFPDLANTHTAQGRESLQLVGAGAAGSGPAGLGLGQAGPLG